MALPRHRGMQSLDLVWSHMHGTLKHIRQRIQELNEPARKLCHLGVNLNRRDQLPRLGLNRHALAF